ncbi:MAG: TIR domain-containing protein [Pseudonocardiaceae bacterium]
MARVFVSHASEDAALAGEVHRWLIDDGHEVFLDQDPRDGIAVGEQREQRLHERLQWAQAVVCLVTSAYVTSLWCAAEVGAARTKGSRLLPVLAEPGVAYSLLTSLQLADLTRDPVAARAALAEALRRVDAAGATGWPDDRAPFPGLRPFEIDEHRVFFGRSGDVDKLAARLRSPSERAEGAALLVVGPSGCGKSSLVRAGLVPLMAREPGWWTLPPIVPGTHPVAALVRELAGAAREVGLEWTVAQVRSRLDEVGLAELADELLLEAPGDRRRLLVVVDQFEELLTQAAPAQRARFAGLLGPALAGPVQVVGTLRSEFLDELLADPELAVLPPPRIVPVRPLHREALRSVIEGPAQLAGIGVDPDLVTRLVADTDSGEALPLLAFTLAQLADGIPRGGRLSSGRYEQLGGVQGALTLRAKEALAAAIEAGSRSPEEVIAGLLRLVTINEQGRPTRWRVSRDELAEPLPTEWDAFVARQLLITDTDNGTVVVSVAHEAFLSAWPPLAQAITAAESALRARRAVEQAAAEWHGDDRPPDRLWERGQLAAAVADTGTRIGVGRRSTTSVPADKPPTRGLARWLPQRHRALVTDRVDLSPTARTFLHASIRRDRYRRRRATTVLSVLLVLALVTAGVAVVQQRTAEEGRRTTEAARQVALSRQLAAEANTIRVSNPRRAMLLALKAWQTSRNVETRSSLLSTQMENYDGDLRGYRGAVQSAAFSPDGSLVAAGGYTDGTIRLWDAASGHEVANLPASTRQEGVKEPPIVTTVVFSPDGRTLVSNAIATDGLRLWAVATRRQLAVFPTSGSAIALSPNGMVLAVGDREGNVKLWDVTSRTQLATLTGHQDVLFSIAFSPDGRLLATAGKDKMVRLWDLHTHQEIAQLLGHTDLITRVAISPDGRVVASSSFDKTMRLWDVEKRQTKKIYTFGDGVGAPDGMTFSPDGTWLVVSGTFRAISAINLATSEQYTLASPVNARDVAFDHTGHRLVTAGYDGPVQLWRFQLTSFIHVSAVVGIAFDPSGQTLVSGSADHTVRLWDVKRGKLLHEFTGHTKTVKGVAFRPDGKIFAAAGDDGTIRLWDPATGVQRAVLTRPDTVQFQEPKFSPDGAIVVATGIRVPPKFGQPDLPNTEPVIWDAATGREIGRLPADNQTVWSLAFAPDGATIAGGLGDGRIRLWDRATRKLRADLPGHPQPVYTLAYSPDGRVLASGGYDGIVQLWDTSTWQLVGSVPRFSSAVRDIKFSPDGATMATASDDDTVRLIDVVSRTVSANLDRHIDTLNEVAFSPDGAIVASAGGDGRVFLWTVRESQAERRLCEVIKRGATPNEWSEIGPDRGTPPQCP